MTLQNIIITLKEYLAEMPALKQLHYRDTNNRRRFDLWRDKVRFFLESCFGKDSEERALFRGLAAAYIDNPQATYLGAIEACETDLMKIIQRLEMQQVQTVSTNQSVSPVAVAGLRLAVFIAHGGQSAQRDYLELFLWRKGYRPVIVEELPSLGMPPDRKVDFYMEKSEFGVIFAEADRAAVQDDKFYPRLNIIDEMVRIRKTLRNKFILLLEEGLSLNSDEQVTWERFTKDTLDKACNAVLRELKAHSITGADELGEHAY